MCDALFLYRKKKKSKNKDKTIEKINKEMEQVKTKEYYVPPTKAELAFMKQQEKLVSTFYLRINIDKCFIHFDEFYIYIHTQVIIYYILYYSLKLILFFIEF